MIIEGKKYELAGGSFRNFRGSDKGLLELGTYKDRIAREERKSLSELFRDYEFLLPGKTTRPFTVVGIGGRVRHPPAMKFKSSRTAYAAPSTRAIILRKFQPSLA